jgi:hypothetical protein
VSMAKMLVTCGADRRETDVLNKTCFRVNGGTVPKIVKQDTCAIIPFGISSRQASTVSILEAKSVVRRVTYQIYLPIAVCIASLVCRSSDSFTAILPDDRCMCTRRSRLLMCVAA